MFLFGSSPCIYLVPSDTTSRQHHLFPPSSPPGPLTHIVCFVRFVLFFFFFCSGLVVRYSDNWRTTNPANCTGCVVSYSLLSWYSSPSVGLNAGARGSLFIFPSSMINGWMCNNTKHMVAFVPITTAASHRLHIVLLCDTTWPWKFLCSVSFCFQQTLLACWGCNTSAYQSLPDDLCLQCGLCSQIEIHQDGDGEK